METIKAYPPRLGCGKSGMVKFGRGPECSTRITEKTSWFPGKAGRIRPKNASWGPQGGFPRRRGFSQKPRGRAGASRIQGALTGRYRSRPPATRSSGPSPPPRKKVTRVLPSSALPTTTAWVEAAGLHTGGAFVRGTRQGIRLHDEKDVPGPYPTQMSPIVKYRIRVENRFARHSPKARTPAGKALLDSSQPSGEAKAFRWKDSACRWM